MNAKEMIAAKPIAFTINFIFTAGLQEELELAYEGYFALEQAKCSKDVLTIADFSNHLLKSVCL
jgi:hypothetical protein